MPAEASLKGTTGVLQELSDVSQTSTGAARAQSWSPWRAVFAFGLVSLFADMVYEGLRSMIGPFLGSLGASALAVGIITGAGEGAALVLRLATGVWADRSQRHWRLTVVGYAMTAVCVPLLALAPFIGGVGLALAALLFLLERVGKAVRSPSKSVLLATMAVQTGRGRGFGVHKALDQVGAFVGPLVLAGMTALTGVLWPGFAVLAIPGAISLALLAQLRRRVPSMARPLSDEGRPAQLVSWRTAVIGTDLPRTFHAFSLAIALTTTGLMTFGVISYALVSAEVVAVAAIPLVYALAMAVAALAALSTGEAFDRWGPRILLVVPVLVAAVPLCVFTDHRALVLLGVALWGMASGIQDSTVKALVAELVPVWQRGSAYGVFAAVQGVGALAGGALAGALAIGNVLTLAVVIGVLQVVSFAMLWRILHHEVG